MAVKTKDVTPADENEATATRLSTKAETSLIADSVVGPLESDEAFTAADSVAHESVAGDPRDGTTALQNAVDWNDAKRARPQDETFAGQGIDRSVYGERGQT